MGGRVLVCGAWDRGPGYPRSESLLTALRVAQVEVHECRIDVPWRGADKRRLVQSPWRWPQLLWSARSGRRALVRKLERALKQSRPDAILIPYPGHLFAADVARGADVPVVLDLFLSAYDTAVEDRRLFRPGSLRARAMRWLDRRACAAVDLVLVDTEANARHVAQLTGVDADRVAWVPVSDPAAPDQVSPYQPPAADRDLHLLFFGTGVPLHGLPTLIEAVRRSPRVRLTLVGGSAAEREMARSLPEGVLDLQPEFVDRQTLQGLLDRCHLVAGIFGTSAKAGRVIPYKVVHGLASGRPVLTADTPAVRGLLEVGEEVLTCRAGDAADLVRALAQAADDPSRLAQVAEKGRAAYERCFAIGAVTSRLCGLLTELTSGAIEAAVQPGTPPAGKAMELSR